MRMRFAPLAGVALTGILAAAQPAFEVAAIRPREPAAQPPQTRMIVTPGRIDFQAVLLAAVHSANSWDSR